MKRVISVLSTLAMLIGILGMFPTVAFAEPADDFVLTVSVRETTLPHGENFKFSVELKNNSGKDHEITYSILFWPSIPGWNIFGDGFIQTDLPEPQSRLFEAGSVLRGIGIFIIGDGEWLFGADLELGTHELRFRAEFWLDLGQESQQKIEIWSDTIVLTVTGDDTDPECLDGHTPKASNCLQCENCDATLPRSCTNGNLCAYHFVSPSKDIPDRTDGGERSPNRPAPEEPEAAAETADPSSAQALRREEVTAEFAGEEVAEEFAAVIAEFAESARASTGVVITQVAGPMVVSAEEGYTIAEVTMPEGVTAGEITTMAVVTAAGGVAPVPTLVNPEGTVLVIINGETTLVPLNVKANFT